MSDKLRDVIVAELQRQGDFLGNNFYSRGNKPGVPMLYDGELDMDELCRAIRVALNIAEPFEAQPSITSETRDA